MGTAGAGRDQGPGQHGGGAAARERGGDRAGPTQAGLLLYLEPLAGAAGAAALLGEGLSPATLAGGVLTMPGVGTAWLSRR